MWGWIDIARFFSSVFLRARDVLDVASSWKKDEKERAEVKGRIGAAHREIQKLNRESPGYAGFKDPRRDLRSAPRTDDETECATRVLEHFDWAYAEHRARRYDLPEYLPEDIRQFFSRPVCREVWRAQSSCYHAKTRAHIEKVAGDLLRIRDVGAGGDE